ncbi:MAG: alpha/beta hydrolase [Planctomycetaceae bacterium]|jgi:pimeloyl-ACP methyl ester carboxylesterase|nr:alpha/beta hydrolase [Planctomycetaceae bacterium]
MNPYQVNGIGYFVRQQYNPERDCGRPILFIHGYPFDSSLWEPVFPFIPDSYRLIAPDLRGLGKTPLPESAAEESAAEEAVTMENFADDLAVLLDAMDVKEPLTLCGLSMGGYIAMRFAAKYPDRLAGMILSGTKTAADTAQIISNRQKQAAGLRSGTLTLKDVADLMLPQLLSPKTFSEKPKVAETVRTMIETNNPLGAAAAAAGMALRKDTADVVRNLTVPVQTFGGSDDKYVPPAEMNALAKKAKSGLFTEFLLSGHLPPMEQPETFANAVLLFVDSLFQAG